jgi:hypothetical protein
MFQQDSGSFIATTNIWDVSEVYQVEGLTPQLKELLVRMYQNLNLMATAVDTKESGFYVQNEFVNGNLFFPNPYYSSKTATTPNMRQECMGTVYYPTALPSSGTATIPHNLPITAGTTFTEIRGSSTNPSLDGIPLPYASASGDNIELSVDATNVYITTNSASWTSYTTTYIIVKYLKQ